MPALPAWINGLPTCLPPPAGLVRILFTAPLPTAAPPVGPLMPQVVPSVVRTARIIRLFNQGRVPEEQLLRVVRHAILRCGTDWHAALRCLNRLSAVRNPATGTPLPPDLAAVNAAMAICARAGCWPVAIALFNRLLACGLCPDSRTYTLAITACRRGGNAADALGMFWHLETFASRAGVRPTIHTLTTVISALGAAGHADIAIRLFGRLLAHNGPPGQRANLRTYNAVLEVCAAAGRQADAMSVLHLLEAAPAGSPLAPDARSYMYAIAACSPRRAPSLIDRALARGLFQPSLGFDAQRNILDLRQGSVLLGDLHPQDDGDVHPALAGAIVRRLAGRGALDAGTVYVSRQSGCLPPGLGEEIARAGVLGPGAPAGR